MAPLMEERPLVSTKSLRMSFLRSENILTASADCADKETMAIIIDDVVTTGSTMREAVHAMRNAGFANAWGLSIAH